MKVITGCSPTLRVALANRVCKGVRARASASEPVVRLASVSIGVADLRRAGFHSAEELFRTADLALYSAKERGGDRVMLAPNPHGPRHTAPFRTQAHAEPSFPEEPTGSSPWIVAGGETLPRKRRRRDDE